MFSLQLQFTDHWNLKHTLLEYLGFLNLSKLLLKQYQYHVFLSQP